MSSHHIIREAQEPALLIADAQAASYTQVQELLEWSPTVVVTEWALPKVLSWGIKIDVVVAQRSGISTLSETLHDQIPLKMLSCKGEHDAMATALYFLIASKQKAVNILSQASLKTLESFSSLDVSVLQAGKRWCFIRSGIFEKWLPAGRILHVFPEDQISCKIDGNVTIQKQHGFWVAEE